MIVKSINKVNLSDGEYHGIWEGLYVSVDDLKFKVGRASKTKVGCTVKVEGGTATVNSEGRGMTKEEAQKLLDDVNKDGLGAWICNEEDSVDEEAEPRLKALKSKAAKAINEVEEQIIKIINKHGIE